ncbi:DsbA family protein [Janibacter sp. GXQ6167]|uniref:DsbA family protein n=1 Tax=Janibacter sp. GXQ6167 TaxID=3240791 RepID=UPI003525A0B9
MTDPRHAEHATVEMWFDPVCPWAWMTSRWLMEVEKVRDVTVTWSQMSLAMLNEGRELDEEYAELLERAWAPVRVIAAARALRGDEITKPLYDALGEQIHRRGEQDPAVAIPAALAALDLPPELADAASDSSYDATVRESHDRALALVGDDVGTPVIAVGEVAFFGPVVSPAPKGEAAGRLWDGCLLVAGTDGFFELKRSRTRDPIL